MKNLQPNLDATTNIEVPLQGSTRILGLDEFNNIVELTSTTRVLDGDGMGDMDGSDLMDMDGSGPLGDTPSSSLTGLEFCYDLPLFRRDINPCYEVGNTVLITDDSTISDGAATVLNTEVISIEETITPGTTSTYTGAGADINGYTAGSALWSAPWMRPSYIWEVISETSPSSEGSSAGDPWQFVDLPWYWPNQVGQFWLPGISTFWEGDTSNPASRTLTRTVTGGNDLTDVVGGTLLYGAFHDNNNGWDNVAEWNDTPVGSIANVYHHATIQLRKVANMSVHPDPQLWVSTGGFSLYCIYPPFSASHTTSGIPFSFTTGTVTLNVAQDTAGGRTVAAGAHTMGQWFPTRKADGTLNGIPDALQQYGVDGFLNIGDIASNTAQAGSVISTSDGFVNMGGPFGLRVTGGSFTLNTSGEWRNNVTDGSRSTHLNALSDMYLGDTVADSNRARLFGAVGSPTTGYVSPGATLVYGSYTPGAEGSVPTGGGTTADTAVTTICVEVVDHESPIGDSYVFDTSRTFDFNPLCATSGGGGGDPDSTDDGMGGIDTRTCTSKKIGRTDGILLYTSGTTELAAGVDLSTNPTLSTIDLDLTSLGEELATLTTSTTLTDVEDGSLEISVGDASLTVGYSSAAINGNVVTLGGDVTGGAQSLGDFVSGTTAPGWNSPQVSAVADLANVGTTFGAAAGNFIRFFFSAATDVDTFLNTLTNGDTTSHTNQFTYRSLSNNGGATSADDNAYPLTLTSGANTITFQLGSFSMNTATQVNFRAVGGQPFGVGTVTGAGSYAQADGLTWTASIDGTVIGNLTVTDGVGEWFVGTAQVCLNGSGGDASLGGDLSVGGDTTSGGKLTLRSVGTTTPVTLLAVDADGCVVDGTALDTDTTLVHNLTGTNIVPFWDGDSFEDSIISQESFSQGYTLQTTSGFSPADNTFVFYNSNEDVTYSTLDLSSITIGNDAGELNRVQFGFDTAAEVANLLGVDEADVVQHANAITALPQTLRLRFEFDANNFAVFDFTGYNWTGTSTTPNNVLSLANDTTRDLTTGAFVEGMGNLSAGTSWTVSNPVATGATVTGDLTVTGEITGTISNTNTASPTAFQFWAGTQAEFDAQFGTHDSAGEPSPGGGFVCSVAADRTVTCTGTVSPSSQGAEDTTGAIAYLIRG